MLVYNITMQIAPAIEQAWLQWQQQEHIPEIMSTGLFREYKFYRLLEPKADDSATYVIQYYTPTMENYQTYLHDFAPAIRQKIVDKWGNQFIAFRTIMEVVN